jgi:tRNA A37 threonylcarbamoyladenosine synthetase subunit TsaC/SUA5/YrdC
MDFDLLNAVSYLEKPDGVIAIPFKGRYLLVCRLEHNDALGRLYRLSCTQQNWQPMLLGYDFNALSPFISNPPSNAMRLMEQYWPGGLVIRMAIGIHLQNKWFEPSRLGLMQPNDGLIRDILSLQPGGILMAVDACRYHDVPAQTATVLYNSFGDDVDFVLQRDEAICQSNPETVVSIELDGSLRVLRSGEVVLD